MNEAHWHLVVNHMPIMFPIIGILVLIAGMILKSEIIKRTAYGIFIVTAGMAAISMNTGEGAEEIVEKFAGVTEEMIHEHEEAAEIMAIFSYVLGALSLIAMWASWKGKTFANILSFVVLLGALGMMFQVKTTGTTGGEIRHQEIRPDFNVAAPGSPGNAEQQDND